MTRLSQETTALVRGSEGRGAGVSFPEEVGIGVDTEFLMEQRLFIQGRKQQGEDHASMKNLPVNESLSGEILVSGVSSSYIVRVGN